MTLGQKLLLSGGKEGRKRGSLWSGVGARAGNLFSKFPAKGQFHKIFGIETRCSGKL